MNIITPTAPAAGQPERADRVNWSTLKAIGTSPKHYLNLLANRREDTDALRLGRMTHCLVFEPDQFNARYIVSPRFHRGQNDETAIKNGYDGGKQAAAEWLSRVGSREVVEADAHANAYAMRQSILTDSVAAPFVTLGYAEHRIEWLDTLTGIECRGRVDHVNGCLSDLKTTRSLLSFERDVARYGYHAQLAWYADGLETAGIETTNPPCLVAVESVPPFDVLVLTFTEEDLAVGRRVYRANLDRLAECRRTGFWPGMSNGVARRIVLPSWAGPVEDVELTIGGEPLL